LQTEEFLPPENRAPQQRRSTRELFTSARMYVLQERGPTHLEHRAKIRRFMARFGPLIKTSRLFAVCWLLLPPLVQLSSQSRAALMAIGEAQSLPAAEDTDLHFCRLACQTPAAAALCAKGLPCNQPAPCDRTKAYFTTPRA